MKTVLKFILLATFIAAELFPLSEGTLKGRVYTNDFREPLIGANVIILSTNMGTITDTKGEFEIKKIPAGTYNIEFRFLGYEKTIKTDISIKPGIITFLEAGLKESTVQTKEITVNSGYFRNDEGSPLGYTNLNTEEIKRAPGSAGDVSRLLLVLPSTAKVSDNQNDLAVRGGSPAENGFFVDGIQVTNINHFPSIGSSGGPIGLLNIDFIDNVNFYAGGFSSQYADRLSSVVDISFREGNREQYNALGFFNFTGFGARIEGPLFNNKGSFLISGSKSYLDLFVDAIGLGIAPRYGDIQGKLVYDINPNHKISFLNIFGQSMVDLAREKAIEHGNNDYYGVNKNLQNSAGVTWTAFWNSKFYSSTSLSHSIIKYDNSFNKVINYKPALNAKITEQYLNFRNINYAPADGIGKLEFGLDAALNLGNYDYARFADTNKYGGIDPDYFVDYKIKPSRAGLFLTYISKPVYNFQLTAGIRGDYYSLNEEMDFSPRVILTYSFNDITKISFNGGLLFQQMPMFVTSQKREFENLRNMRSYHFGAGFEHMLSSDTKLTLEVYNKQYDYLPVDKSDPYYSVIDGGMFNTQFKNYNDLVSTGKANTKGIEVMVQKKLAEDIYGMVSGSYYRSRYTDYFGNNRDRIYDNKFLFNIIGGYKPGSNWELSIRWTYAGGAPYTPFDKTKSEQFGVGIIDETRINDARMPDYHTLNFRVDKKFYFSSSSLDIYLNVLNAYNRQNVGQITWDKIKNKEDRMLQWTVMPVIGIEYEL